MSQNDPIELSDTSSSESDEPQPEEARSESRMVASLGASTMREDQNGIEVSHEKPSIATISSPPTTRGVAKRPRENYKATKQVDGNRKPAVAAINLEPQETIEIEESSDDEEIFCWGGKKTPVSSSPSVPPMAEIVRHTTGESISDNRKPAVTINHNVQSEETIMEVDKSSSDDEKIVYWESQSKPRITFWGNRHFIDSSKDDPSVIDISSSSSDDDSSKESEPPMMEGEADDDKTPSERQASHTIRSEMKPSAIPFRGSFGFLREKKDQTISMTRKKDDPSSTRVTRSMAAKKSTHTHRPHLSDSHKKDQFKKNHGLTDDPEWMKAVEEAVQTIRHKRPKRMSIKAKRLRQLQRKKRNQLKKAAIASAKETSGKDFPIRSSKMPCHIRGEYLDHPSHPLPQDRVTVILTDENYGYFDSSVDLLDECFEYENSTTTISDEIKNSSNPDDQPPKRPRIPGYIIERRINEVKQILRLLFQKLGTKGLLDHTKEYLAKLMNVTERTIHATCKELSRQDSLLEEEELEKEDEEEQTFDEKYRKLMSTPLRLLCNRCQVYDCTMHGTMDDYSSLLATEIAMKKEDSAFWKPFENSQAHPCVSNPTDDITESPVKKMSTKKRGGDSGTDANTEIVPLSKLERVLLQQIYFIYRGDLDKVSKVSGIPMEIIMGEDLQEFKYKLLEGRKVDPSRFHYSCKTAKQKSHMFRSESARKPVHRAVFTPCCHDRPCSAKKNCPCWKNGFACTSHCLWGPLSRNFFPGCNCKGKCTTESCPCHMSGRECDPDTCLNCKTCTDPVGETRRSQQTCCNDNIRMRRRKSTVIRKSTVENAGWGLFAGTNLKKGEYIDEYVGEVIHDNDGEIHGLEQDEEDRNYLFDLPNEYCVDALRIGNNTRYMNHAGDNPEDHKLRKSEKTKKKRGLQPNVRAKILSVDGDPRIAFYALKNVVEGEELFFDYGKTYFSRKF